MLHTVERLEKCLRAWEDWWYLIGILNRVLRSTGRAPLCSNDRAVTHWLDYRKFVLRHGVAGHTTNMSNFDAPADMPNGGEMFLTGLPIPILEWCGQSRRVYTIQAELQALLNATSLEGVRWSDVSLPFKAFALNLSQPFTDGELEVNYDFILLCAYIVGLPNGQQIPTVDLRAFATSCDLYEPLTEANRQNLSNRLRNREWEHVERLTWRFLNRIDCVLGSYFYLHAESFDELVTDTAQRVYDQGRVAFAELLHGQPVAAWDTMIRITVGMCLYLKTLPSGSSHQSQWRPAPRSSLADPRAISNEAQICTVSSCYTLTRPERVALGLEGTAEERRHYELSCHFRQGHWRRPPGYGHLPDAPKTVHVRPCLVRKDRLQEGELPGGAETVL